MPDTVQIDTTFSRLKSRSSSWFQEFEERFNRTLLGQHKKYVLVSVIL